MRYCENKKEGSVLASLFSIFLAGYLFLAEIVRESFTWGKSETELPYAIADYVVTRW